MDWIAPINAGSSSAFVVNKGDRIICPYCWSHVATIVQQPEEWQLDWNTIFRVEGVKEQPEKGAPMPILCHSCHEPTIIYEIGNDTELRAV